MKEDVSCINGTEIKIKQAAIKYCDDMWGSESTTEQEAYIAGAESRQAEIDELASAPELLDALETLVFLHSCEQEGIGCGQPTPEMWYAAVEAAQKAIDKAKGE